MPFQRPTLTQLRANVVAAINAQLPGADALLRFSNVGVLGTVQAGLSHQHYGYLDWIALQTNPFTATGEYLEAWGALKDVYRKAAVQASGPVTFPCAALTDTVLPGTALLRSDGVGYLVLGTGIAVASPAGSTQPYQITVTAVATPDPTGLTGAFGDCAAGTQFTLGQTIPGVTSSGVSGLVTGGADLEDDTDFRARVIEVYQNAPQGGAQADYVTWALQVPGVTRAWCQPLYLGAGTVGVYFMMDETESAHQGVPQGTNGAAAAETRAVAATGDQLTVANFIYPLRPVTALVYSLAPTLLPINLTITGVSAGNQAAVQAALASTITGLASVGGTIELAALWASVRIADPSDDILITAPLADIVAGAGQLPSLGAITW
ncbi:MAG: baseplate J/gp47 family protein [Patescibacteria group bacterium]|nr:baseplate J/gp47 family protein [Patescibacteria group bacterium]